MNISSPFNILEVQLPKGWLVSQGDEGMVQFCFMMSSPSLVAHSMSVQADFSWYAHVTGQIIPRSNQTIQQLPQKVADEIALFTYVSGIVSAHICPVNPEECFTQLLENIGGSVKGNDGQVTAFSTVKMKLSVVVLLTHAQLGDGTVKCFAHLMLLILKTLSMLQKNIDHNYKSCVVDSSPKQLQAWLVSTVIRTIHVGSFPMLRRIKGSTILKRLR